MNNPSNFSFNLRTIQKESNLSLAQFSQKLRIPKATMQSVMKEGNTSLDTACKISNALEMPLSALTSSTFHPETAHILHRLLDVFSWYSTLPVHRQEQVEAGIRMILGALKK